MAEYIERQSVHAMVKGLKQYKWTSPISNETHVTVGIDDMKPEIDKIPAADVVPGNLFRELKNELCWRCGKYKDQHLGACDGCKWRLGVGR